MVQGDSHHTVRALQQITQGKCIKREEERDDAAAVFPTPTTMFVLEEVKNQS